MMKYNSLIILVGILAMLQFSACSFEEINTNPLEMTDEQGVYDDFALGGRFLAMQRSVTPVGTQADGTDIINQYQIAYHLSADVWSGYFGQNNNWNTGNNHTTNYLVDNWVTASYSNSYAGVFSAWKKIRDVSIEQDVSEYYALAQILKISAWHKTTDMFGPIPYKEAGKPMLVVPYDSQEEVYTHFFTDLEAAIEVLTSKGEETLLVPRFDAIYGGNISKWIRYANSLMLRLAMRVRYANPEMAKKYAEMAVNHPIGVMTAKDDEAKIAQGAGFSFINNIETCANQYGETRMGSSMYSYLVGYKDPRLSAYFKASDSQFAEVAFDGKKYHAIPTGHVFPKNDIYLALSKPNIEKSTPTYWMRASEVYFLRSEGALLKWNMGSDEESLYKQGIILSFEENGIAANGVTTYMNSDNKPVDYSLKSMWYNADAATPTVATAKFAGSTEEKLEKIMIQKWIALYPNGQEAWSEWRRTGYPKLHPVINDRGNLGAKGVRRIVYPLNAYQSEDDRLNIEEAIKMLGGEDKASTKLWWDAKN